MLAEMITRLFERSLDDAAQAAAREGQWLPALWAEVEEMGLPLALLTEDQGGFGLSFAEAGEALRLLGSHAMPLPVAETMAANQLLAAAGLPLAEGPSGLARADDLTISNGRLSGTVARVAWGEQLDCLALAVGDKLYRVPRSGWSVAEAGTALNFHPRPSLALDWAIDAEAALPWCPLAGGATVRAYQIAGALEAALEMTLSHTATRVQFGKPLQKNQVVQHELAKLAGELACATAAADLAGEALARRDVLGVAAGSQRAREAAGAGASIATQMHGAIGFTREHRLHLYTTSLWTWRDEFGGQVSWAKLLGSAAIDAGGPGYWPMVTAL
ncbi:acyl-CoA dehydrogenase family protein [Novosphingobium sp.]|uniref:acyl-CoA dehydrogenase family protein n=1 Tax=Novosphingobium sp. TaxID=1874826 RepID=UPI0022BF5A9E|nr:acyl-CoA dehydrogenase family protein [Novosphingobium sp.]MCZ8019328.1 acyl-CoA dehydrogenase family protein [Novosphingobium sp.]MCZ8035143.1 acyl-CoA dehydrogenase family protein [Novosphingobium sp.]MCZ8050457.1 acyl-CoA dehydrogenase family protein [Novosphingobium sp.]MCZ8058803.1 acyl-CoA dehydrogenase family protein [Novosphingobium sp.]MCZ8232248.1 acyl-CoA dehydrogenase family protein [Novosphingobium sp.]